MAYEMGQKVLANIKTFEKENWNLNFKNFRFETAEDFTFLQSNVVPVLVSADFLQMVELVEYAAKETVKFISKVNLKVLSKGLIEKVANHMQVKEAECVLDENVREDVYKGGRE